MDAQTYNDLKKRVDAYEKLDKEKHLLEHTKELLYNGSSASRVLGVYTSTSKHNSNIEIPKCLQMELGDVLKAYLDKEIQLRSEAMNALE